MMFIRFFQKIKERFKKSPLFIQSIFFGVLSGLSFEPYKNIISFTLGILGFLYCLNRNETTIKQSILMTSCFFYGYYFISLYWIQFSFLSVDLWFAIPPAMLSFPLIFCLFSFWVGIVLHYTKQTNFYSLSFALCFFCTELMIGQLCTGFPWILSAYTLHHYAAQGGAYIGVYGMSLCVLLWTTQFYKAKNIKIFVLLSFLIVVHVLGYYRLESIPISNTSTTIRLIHPRISQKNKMDYVQMRAIFDQYLNLCTIDGEHPLDLIVWPEASIPIAFNQYPALLEMIHDVVPENGFVIASSPFVDDENSKTYTSCYILNKKNEIVDIYHKIHLVPFGEYLPFRRALEKLGFNNMTAGRHDFSEGFERPVYHLNNIPPFCILICYDAIFPNAVLSTTSEKPEWLLNVTNDAWYIGSIGIYQHLNIVRWRAIEEGIPIIRCVNSGVSAIIDGAGRIVSSISFEKMGVLDAYIPKPLPYKTFYQKIREFIMK